MQKALMCCVHPSPARGRFSLHFVASSNYDICVATARAASAVEACSVCCKHVFLRSSLAPLVLTVRVQVRRARQVDMVELALVRETLLLLHGLRVHSWLSTRARVSQPWTPTALRLSASRTSAIAAVAAAGIDVLACDVDTLVLAPPWARLRAAPDAAAAQPLAQHDTHGWAAELFLQERQRSGHALAFSPSHVTEVFFVAPRVATPHTQDESPDVAAECGPGGFVADVRTKVCCCSASRLWMLPARACRQPIASGFTCDLGRVGSLAVFFASRQPAACLLSCASALLDAS
eukprot:594853-Pleurochrysis_carterae.AAC.14